MTVPPPIAAPFLPARRLAQDDIQSMPKPVPTRFVKRGFYMCCPTCNLTIEYCPGHGPPDAQSPDSADSGLAQRVLDVLKQRGTGSGR